MAGQGPKMPILPEEVGAAALAGVLRVNPQTIKKWHEAGHLKQCRPGWYNLSDAVHAWAEYKYGSGEDSPRKVIEQQKALKLKRENARENNELIPSVYHEGAIDRLCLAMKVWFRALPGRISSVGAMTEAGVLRELVRVECARAAEEIRVAAQSDFESLPPELGEDASTDTHAGHLGRPN